MRTFHNIPKAGPASAPSNILVVDTETWHGRRARYSGGERHKLRLGYLLAYRLERGQRTRIADLHFRTSDQFWRFLESRLDSRRPLWVFAHNTAYDFSVLGWIDHLLDGPFICGAAIITQGVFHLKGTYHDSPVVFSDTGNYYHCSLESVGEAVGLPKLETPAQDDSDERWAAYCQNDVEVTAAGIDKLIGFIRENELGPWGVSIASLSFNAFRSRFMSHDILVDCYRDDLQTARDSYYGGIVDTPFIGTVPFSPVHELDVNSMYASACLEPLPRRIISRSDRCGVQKLLKCPPDQMMIAKVTINDNSLRFPLRRKNGTCHPVGKYVTTLAHPELMVALRAGAIKWVHKAVWYGSAPVFADYMSYFSDKKIWYSQKCDCVQGFQGESVGCIRCGFGREANTAFRTLAKYYLTNLYGKMGQLSPNWEIWGETALMAIEKEFGYRPGELARWYDWPPEVPTWSVEHWKDPFGNFHPIRSWFGFTQVEAGRHESRDSVPAIAACVTSYARVFLRQCQDIAGDRNWVYSDTDSIWVNDVGLQNLQNAGLVANGVLGKLEYKARHEWVRIFGPKDYVTPDGIKLKGVKPLDEEYCEPGDVMIPVRTGPKDCRCPPPYGKKSGKCDRCGLKIPRLFIRTPGGKYRQVQFPSALTQIKQQMRDGPELRYLEKELYREQTKCVVLPDGWTRPLRLPEEDK